MDLLHPSDELAVPAPVESLPLKKHRRGPSVLNLLFLGVCLIGVSGFLLFAGFTKTTAYEEGAPLSIFDTLALKLRAKLCQTRQNNSTILIFLEFKWVHLLHNLGLNSLLHDRRTHSLHAFVNQ